MAASKGKAFDWQILKRTLSYVKDYKLIFGKNPNTATGYSDLKLYEFLMFKKALTVEEINRLNQFYIEKINSQFLYEFFSILLLLIMSNQFLTRNKPRTNIHSLQFLH